MLRRHGDGSALCRRRRMELVELARVLLEVEIAAESFPADAASELRCVKLLNERLFLTAGKERKVN